MLTYNVSGLECCCLSAPLSSSNLNNILQKSHFAVLCAKKEIL